MTFFNGLYTLQDIAIHHNFDGTELASLTKLSNSKNIQAIAQKCPSLRKFIPYCKCYEKNGRNVYAMPAYIYDLYMQTGLLIDIDIYDTQPNKEKLNYWEYTPTINLELNLSNDWDFATEVYKEKNQKVEQEDIWKMFLAGCARMDYYQNEKVDIDKRVKYAIVEYMMKRPQFFTTDDFIDNPVLHKKYSK